MHALHLPTLHGWKVGGLALALTLVLLVLAAVLAPAVVDLSAPSATTVETAPAASEAPPAWAQDPLAPPALLR